MCTESEPSVCVGPSLPHNQGIVVDCLLAILLTDCSSCADEEDEEGEESSNIFPHCCFLELLNYSY